MERKYQPRAEDGGSAAHVGSWFLSSQYSDLEQQGTTDKSKLEQRVAELERSLLEQKPSGDMAAEVSRRLGGTCSHTIYEEPSGPTRT